MTGTAEQDLETLTAAMTAATAQAWLPLLKTAVDRASHGNGRSASPDEAIRRALDKALALAPGDWELLCLRGTILAGRSEFDLALKDFDRSIELAPKSPRPFAGRSYLHTRLGDWNAALADLDRAAALSGAGAGSSLDRGLVLLSLGRAAEARAEFAKSPSDPEARYQLGRALLAEGKTEEAREAIRAALQGSGADSSRRRSYEMMEAAAAALGHIAKSGKAAGAPGEKFMSDAKKTAAKDGKGCLWLLGVGIDRPYEVTLNTLMALKRCDAVYTQADTREVRELLEAVFPGVHSIAVGGGKGANPQETVWKTVKAELDKGSQTGYVTYGHPMLFGEGNMMAKRCKDAGYPYRVMTAPSSIDGILTMLQEDLELCERGFTVQNARSLAEPGAAVDSSKGAIILGVNRVMEENKFGTFCDRLEAAFPKEHVLYALKCGDGYRDETRLKLTVAEFRRKERELDPALTLFVPEIKGNSPAPKPRRKGS
ncbi:MAG: tetratricopeptide repeat protein [Elusimicrobia bacterium]|nr:tetratricopeptide repeat protein [Elusimicrobiota bacterium]